MATDIVTYRALESCRVGSYRETGEEFAHVRILPCPPYLQELSAEPESSLVTDKLQEHAKMTERKTTAKKR